ncbi:hypothetical protein LBMAG21_10460 [Armatimonadota bacterium]|nr:hypothetical protein LBMAG21_10460 [Armatimonadota bacterium]
MDERKTVLDYSPETYARVCQALLHVATVLGDWMEQVTLIGGIVPSLLVPLSALPEGADLHPGTADLDLGLELSVLTEEGYATISELLRQAGYRAMEKEEDRIRRQTWRTDPALGAIVTIDFLIARSPEQPPKTRIQNLEPDFAALIADGLQLVARDRRKIPISGLTIRGERAERFIWVCGPASFVVLKARAIHLREKPKDAFDLHYILMNVEGGVDKVAGSLRQMLDDKDAVEAIEFLRQAYLTIDSIGPSRTAFFLHGARSADTQEDYDDLAASAHAYVNRMLAALK